MRSPLRPLLALLLVVLAFSTAAAEASSTTTPNINNNFNFAVLIEAAAAAPVCVPKKGITRAKCLKLVKACSAASVLQPMKWVIIPTKKKCKVDGKIVAETGCKCLHDCGYVCESSCALDAQCKWEDGTCMHRASGLVGESQTSCAYTQAPTPPPTKSNSKLFTAASPKLVVDTTKLPGNVQTGKQGLSLATNNDVILVGGPMDDFGTGTVFQYKQVANKKDGDSTTPVYASFMLERAERGKVREMSTSLSLSADGTVALFGAPTHGDGANERGAGFVYTNVAGTWRETAMLSGLDNVGDSHQGQAVALSGDGLTALVGAKDDNKRAGAVWPFRFNGTAWNPIGLSRGRKMTVPLDFKKTAGDFGAAVSLNYDGTVAMIGAPSTGLVFAYSISRVGGKFTLTSTLQGTGAGGAMGESIAMNSAGTWAVIGSPARNQIKGAALVYERDPTSDEWKQTRLLEPFQDKTATTILSNSTSFTSMGTTVAMSGDGNTILVSATATSTTMSATVSATSSTTTKKTATAVVDTKLVAFVFQRYRSTAGSSYTALHTLVPANTKGDPVGGLSVALNERGTVAVLGSPSDDEFIGAAWVFQRDN